MCGGVWREIDGSGESTWCNVGSRKCLRAHLSGLSWSPGAGRGREMALGRGREARIS